MNAIAQPLDYIWSKIFEHRLSATIKFVVSHLAWKKRKTWESAFSHSYRMFKDCLKSWIYDEVILESVLLHDILEDSGLSFWEIRSEFGDYVSSIVEGMTWVDENKKKFKKTEYFLMFRDYCDHDWRILIVKLFDCIDNLETIHGLSREKQELFKREKREVYLPIFEEYTDQIPFETRSIYINKTQELRRLLS